MAEKINPLDMKMQEYIAGIVEKINPDQPVVLSIEDHVDTYKSFFSEIMENLDKKGWEIPKSNKLFIVKNQEQEDTVRGFNGTPIRVNSPAYIVELIRQLKANGILTTILLDMNFRDLFDKTAMKEQNEDYVRFSTIPFLDRLVKIYPEIQIVGISLSEDRAEEMFEDYMFNNPGVKISFHSKDDAPERISSSVEKKFMHLINQARSTGRTFNTPHDQEI